MKGTAHEHLKAVKMYHANLSDGSATSLTPIDTLEFDEALIILDLGIFGGSSPVATVKMQEDDASTGASATDITGATFGAKDETEDDTTYVGRLNLVDRKRYIRPHITVTGSMATGEIAVVAILCSAKNKPVTQVNTADFNV